MAARANDAVDREPLRVGVTGHRTYDDVFAVASAVDGVLDALAARDRSIELWSSLAEGADRLVARRAIATHDAELIAILPLDADDYCHDFESAASLAEFDRLLASASEVRSVGPGDDGSRVSAYLRAGMAVVGAVDVLIAVWDGQPARGVGGTAEIVAAAQDQGVEVIVIPVARPSRTEEVTS